MLSVTDQRYIADPLTESSSGMLAFPWIAQAPGGLLLMTYHDGHDSASPGAYVTRLKASIDRGVTWSAGPVVWDEGIDSGAQITVLSSGDWLMVSQGYSGTTPAGVYSKRSIDGGVTWLPGQPVTDAAFSAGHTYTSSAPLQLASGLLLWPVYGNDAANTVPKVLVSADLGLTWTVGSTILAVPGVDVSEVTLQQMPDGCVVALARCTDNLARRVVSHDDGATWGTPTAPISNCMGRIDWLRLASGRCVAVWRDATSLCALAATSDDDMATISVPVQIHGPDKRTSYSALAEVAPGQVFAAIGEIDDDEAHGRIMGRYLVDGDGMIPTGQTTYLSQMLRAAGFADVLAWDTFGRPDNAQGLGSADSGHQWLEYGGISSNDWKLSGGMAVNAGSSPRIHSTTLATGNKDGFVEASLLWTGGTTSSPIGLCARRSTVTGHAIVAKLDANGTTARISYFDGVNITDLATTLSLTYAAGSWYRFRFVVRGRSARLFIDGQPVVSYTLTATDLANLDGTRWGLWGGGSSGVTYKARNVIVSA